MQQAPETMKVGVCFLGRKRPGFDPEWGEQIEQAARRHAAEADFDAFFPAVRIVDEATLRAAVAECVSAAVDAVVIVQPTMSDGNLAAAMAQVWDGPVVLWATPEKQEGSMISSCSLVGAHTFASTLRQLGAPFELAYGMPGEPECRSQLNDALRLAVAARRMRRGKVGLVGYHAPGFIDMQADPFHLKTRLGLQLRHFGLQDLLAGMEALDQEDVTQDVLRVLDIGLPTDDVTESDLPIASRYYLALKQLLEAESLDALAVRCWSELPNVVGQWPYLAFVRLATEGQSVACEGDVDGAVSCLAAELLGLGQAYLSDWLEHDADTITLWHAGSAPFGLCEPIGSQRGPTLARHFNNKKPLVVNATLQPAQPVTVYRLWRCDDAYRMTAFEGETVEPRRHLLGTNGLARIDGLNVFDLFDELCHAGMPHHVVVVAGRHSRLLRRFARQMHVEWVDA